MAKDKGLTYATFLPFVLLACPLFPSDPTTSRDDETLNLVPPLPPPAARYIVRFAEYRLAADHRAYLETALRAAPPAAWRWVERRNPAAAFPTDFAVLEIRDAQRAAVLAAVEALGYVKDVHADVSYSRSLFVDRGGKGQSLKGSGRRPGKLFTSMSFEGEEEKGGDEELVCSSISNTSVSWRRKLLMQVYHR